MKILSIGQFYPMPDRSAGDRRFFQLLRILLRHHDVSFCARTDLSWQRSLVGDTRLAEYRDALTAMGVRIMDDGAVSAVRSAAYDAVLFEFYHSAESLIDDVRFSQPRARIIVDSVDVAYNRLDSKARVTKAPGDIATARAVKRTELAVYNKADLVITVTEEDRSLLLQELKHLRVEIVPTMHDVSPLDDTVQRRPHSLVFVGSFLHEPNIDAMVYFCNDVLPLVTSEIPDATLDIVGSFPTQSIKALARDGVEVIGFVPDVKPYLDSSYVSIAPLRYGGGMKGKIGEAMAHGLPVVTTTIGIEGFGLTPSANVLIGDSPEEFAKLTCDLLRDAALYEMIRRNGWSFIKERFSEEAVADRVDIIFSRLTDGPVKRLALGNYLRRAVPQQLHRHLLWRFREPARNKAGDS